MIELLIWIGFVRRKADGTVRWPIYVAPWWIWKAMLLHPFRRSWGKCGAFFGLFRNSPGVIKWEDGRLLPRRWGFRVFGFEFGDRG